MGRPLRFCVGLMADPALAEKVATDVTRTLQSHGHVAYFAGGCVRDALLGQQPTDFDIATDATPQRVQDLFERTAAVGAHFGVVLVKRRGVTVEVATFRSDGPYGDRRRPDHVTFSDARADAQRRDFTINALFLDPLAEGAARVIDHVGGQADLAGGIVRAVGDPEQRLAEDHLRALRAVRFAARLGFTIDSGTRDAIVRHASELAGVSRERIGDEIRRMMADPSRQAAGRLVEQLELDGPVLGASARSSGGRLGRLGRSADLGQALGAWLLDRGAVMEADLEQRVGALRRRLLLSNEERADLRDTLACYFKLRDRWRAEGVAWRKRLAAASRFQPAVELLTEGDERAIASHIADDVRNLKGTASGLAPAPLLTGDDLVAAGWRPGPRFGRILEAVYDAQLEDRVATQAEAMELATRLGVEQNRAESSP